MINTDWRQMCHCIALQSVDIPLADSPFLDHERLGSRGSAVQ